MDDLDSKLFNKARALIRSVNSTHPWLEEDDLTILRRALLYRKDFKTGKEGLTLAAALIFGKDETIQSILPAYKVEATNPNKVVFRGILQLDTFSPYPKNPNIRKFFTEFRWTDEIGSGVKNVNKFLKLYTGGAKPLFIEDDDFKTVIPLLVYKFNEKADILFDLLDVNNKLISIECSDELKNLALSVEFAKLKNPDEFFYKKG